MTERIALFFVTSMLILSAGVSARPPADLTDEEVLNLKPGSKELKERLMWEFPQLTDSHSLYSGAQDIVQMYPNDPDWINFFGKLLKDSFRRKYAMLALGDYKARAYEKEILSLAIENKKIMWEALYSLLSMNSSLLPVAVNSAKALLRDRPDVSDQALLNSIEKSYRSKQKK